MHSPVDFLICLKLLFCILNVKSGVQVKFFLESSRYLPLMVGGHGRIYWPTLSLSLRLWKLKLKFFIAMHHIIWNICSLQKVLLHHSWDFLQWPSLCGLLFVLSYLTRLHVLFKLFSFIHFLSFLIIGERVSWCV